MAHRGKILLVDDEPDILETLRDILEMEGYRVALAHNGYEALNRVAQDEFSLALLDYCMPGLNGFETLAEMRKIRPGLAVAFMTAHALPKPATASTAARRSWGPASTVDIAQIPAFEGEEFTCFHKPIAIDLL